MRRHRAAFLAAVLGLPSGAVLAAEAEPIETFRGFAASLGTGRAGALTITIERWSTDQEREMLLTTLQEFGREKLVDTLVKIRPRVGYMRLPNSIGYDLFYARDNPVTDVGRRVVIATNRRVAFREAATNQRSMQYQLTLIELRLDKNGRGEGKMVPAAKISWDTKDKKIEIENYSALPVDLLDVRATQP